MLRTSWMPSAGMRHLPVYQPRWLRRPVLLTYFFWQKGHVWPFQGIWLAPVGIVVGYVEFCRRDACFGSSSQVLSCDLPNNEYIFSSNSTTSCKYCLLNEKKPSLIRWKHISKVIEGHVQYSIRRQRQKT